MTSKITQHYIKYNNNNESLKYYGNYKTVAKKHEKSKCYRKNCTNTLAQYRVVTNLQFIKNAVSMKLNKVKHNKMVYVCKQRFSEGDDPHY